MSAKTPRLTTAEVIANAEKAGWVVQYSSTGLLLRVFKKVA